MILGFDIGNTTITVYSYGEGILYQNYSLQTDKALPAEWYEAILKTLFADKEITSCIISSVVKEITPLIATTCEKLFGIPSVILDSDSNYGMEICVEEPQTVGVDRLVNASVAKRDYKLPAIVIDIGTAITFDVVSKEGNFIGGVIMPGLETQMKSLNNNTSLLPKIEIEDSVKAIGNSTKSAILSGVIRGTANGIKGLIKDCEKELGERPTVIATGGHAEILAKYIGDEFDEINKDLMFNALLWLHERNK